jgi:hypothetical protein
LEKELENLKSQEVRMAMDLGDIRRRIGAIAGVYRSALKSLLEYEETRKEVSEEIVKNFMTKRR